MKNKELVSLVKRLKNNDNKAFDELYDTTWQVSNGNIKDGINVGNLAIDAKVMVELAITLPSTLNIQNGVIENQASAKGINTDKALTTSKINPEKPSIPIDPKEPPVKTTIDTPKVKEVFIKNPTKTIVYEGSKLDYIFSKFNNPYAGSVQNYQIIDLPPVGLEFISGSLPAFTNGSGLTYSITYKTIDGKVGTVASNVDASKAYTFKAPKTSSHISEIAINFVEVPVFFAKGDEIKYTFQVEKVGEKVLVNKGLIRFSVDGVTNEIYNQNDSSVRVNVDTSDSTYLSELIITTISSISIMIFLTMNRKKEIA